MSSSTAPLPEVPGLEDDPEGLRVVREELKLLVAVTHALDMATNRSVDKTEEDARLLELREEVSVAKPEDLPALFEQMHHIGALRAQRGRSVTGTVDRAAPYFGHLRLEENGKRRDILLGSKSYVDPTAGIRIVDWRNAPVSCIYYRYAEGDDYEEILGDKTAEGLVLAKRSVAVVGGELIRVACPQGIFVRGREGVWRKTSDKPSRLFTENRSKQVAKDTARLGIGADGEKRQDRLLPAIASLLDTAQFELIAKPSAGLVAVQGSAGSGKTTVGLHRVAYLAFADPQRFSPERMAVFVPNDALVHYVSRVLPELGVSGVPVTTFGRFARRAIAGLFPKLPTRLTDETPAVVMRAKSHPAMLRSIDRVVARVVARADAKLREGMARWPEGELVEKAWKATAEHPLDLRISALAAWVSGKRSLPNVGQASTLPDVTRGAIERLGQELRQLSRSVVNAWDELVTSRERLSEAFHGIDGFGSARLDQVHDWCVKQARIRSEGDRDGEEPTLDSEDHALLLRIWQRLRGPITDLDGSPIRFAHVFVDEVQDASPIELAVLIDLAGKERCVTLAGDVAQRMLDEDNDAHGEFSWQELLTLLGATHTKIEPLKVSYRSTAEITEFARKILGPYAHDAEPIATRHGPPVELFSFSSVGEAVGWVAECLKQLHRDEPEANVALVARFPQQAHVYYEGLVRAEVPNVRRVAKQDFTWDAGFDITDIRQTKGLEFDEVILLETNASSFPETPQARHALYVGATRAAHQLWCTSSERPSELVTGALNLER